MANGDGRRARNDSRWVRSQLSGARARDVSRRICSRSAGPWRLARAARQASTRMCCAGIASRHPRAAPHSSSCGRSAAESVIDVSHHLCRCKVLVLGRLRVGPTQGAGWGRAPSLNAIVAQGFRALPRGSPPRRLFVSRPARPRELRRAQGRAALCPRRSADSAPRTGPA